MVFDGLVVDLSCGFAGYRLCVLDLACCGLLLGWWFGLVLFCDLLLSIFAVFRVWLFSH